MMLFPVTTALLTLALAAAVLALAAEVWPEREWSRAAPAEMGMDPAQLEKVREYALTGSGSGMVVRGGKQVLAWGDLAHRYDLKSTTKSIGVTALGLALKDGKVRLDDPALKHHPELGVPPEENRKTGWLEKITLR